MIHFSLIFIPNFFASSLTCSDLPSYCMLMTCFSLYVLVIILQISILWTDIYDNKYCEDNLFLFTQIVCFRIPLRIMSACIKLIWWPIEAVFCLHILFPSFQGQKVLHKDFFRWFKHAVLLMHAVVRIITSICTVRKRHTEWIINTSQNLLYTWPKLRTHCIAGLAEKKIDTELFSATWMFKVS